MDTEFQIKDISGDNWMGSAGNIVQNTTHSHFLQSYNYGFVKKII